MIAPIPFLGRSDSDPKWKQFSNSIERALANWDQVAEWADYIAFLSKLSKALSSRHGGFHHVPHSRMVARRLSQCLDPSLPSGVHQKTLEVYNSVFDILKGTLHEEICMWLPGLLPLMAYSSVNVKPRLISLLDNYILPLPGIRALTKPLLLSFLPGIDDESSETFDQVYSLISNLRQKINDDSHFWQCLYLCVISSNDRRFGALLYASRELPKFDSVTSDQDDRTEQDSQNGTAGGSKGWSKLSPEAQLACKPDPGLLIRAICQGTRDSQVLVQRGFLDLLIRNLNLKSPIIQDLASPADCQMLLMSACSTVLSRDMSLNRRLWMWILGPNDNRPSSTVLVAPKPADVSTSSQYKSDPSGGIGRASNYFEEYAMEYLVNGLLDLFLEKDGPLSPQPFRIALYLLDRWEVASCISKQVFVPALRAVYKSYKQEYLDYKEILRSASAFFDGVEAMYIWGKILELIMADDLDLVEYIVDMFNVREEDMCFLHVPLILLVLLSKFDDLNGAQWFSICRTLIDLIPRKAFEKQLSEDENAIDSGQLSMDECVSSIQAFYGNYSTNSATVAEDLGRPSLPFAPQELGRILVSRLCSLSSQSLASCSDTCGELCGLASSALELVDITPQVQESAELVMSSLTQFPGSISPQNFELSADAITGILNLFEATQSYFSCSNINVFVYGMVRELFWRSSDSHEPVAGLWRLQNLLNDNRVDSALAATWVETSSKDGVGSDCMAKLYNSLQSIWKSSVERPDHERILDSLLFLALDGLNTENRLMVANWLNALTSETAVRSLLEMLVARVERNMAESDLAQALYTLRIVVSTLETSPSADRLYRSDYSLRLVTAILQRPSVGSLEYLEQLLPEGKSELLLVVETLIGLLADYSSPSPSSSLLFTSVEVLSCLHILAQALVTIDSASREQLESLMRVCIACIQKPINSIEALSWKDFFSDVLPLYERQHLLSSAVKPLTVALCSASLRDVQLFPPFADILENLLVVTHSASRRQKGHEHRPSFDPSFFSNVISGVFSVEGPPTSPASDNPSNDAAGPDSSTTESGSGITAFGRPGPLFSSFSSTPEPSLGSASKNILVECLEQTVVTCFTGWKDYGPPVKARARKLLTRVYFLEPKIILECIVDVDLSDNATKAKLLHSLDSSRPKVTLPHILKAVANNNFSVAAFMCDYMQSLDNDALEEVWPDLFSFLRDVSQNWSLYRLASRYILSTLGIVGSKISRVRFGDQKRIRKDLGDIFARILTQALSERKKQTSSSNKSSPMVNSDEKDSGSPSISDKRRTGTKEDVVRPDAMSNAELSMATLIELIPVIPTIISDVDKRNSLLTSIMSLVVSPTLKRSTASQDFDDIPLLLNEVSAIPQSEKVWKNTVGDWLFDPRFSQLTPKVADKWIPVISRWTLHDRERIKDHVQKIANASLFGWTEESSIQARNLERLTFLFLCDGQFRMDSLPPEKGNAFTLNMKDLMAKFEAVSINMDKVFDCLRGVVLTVNSELLVPVWTFIYAHVYDVLHTLVSTEEKMPDLKIIVAACKLLDVVLLLNAEDFQVCEWLFICDNMDAIFSRDERDPVGVVDVISQSRKLSTAKKRLDTRVDQKRKPLLAASVSGRTDFKSIHDLKPFFDQLAMFIYEGQYALTPVDLDACRQDLLCDLFN